MVIRVLRLVLLLICIDSNFIKWYSYFVDRHWCVFFLYIVCIFTLRCSNDAQTESTNTASCSDSSNISNDPKSIEDTINLINALPKPLTLDCFLNSLKPPLNVFAVTSTFSAQPAVDQNSPRIFLIKSNFVLSVVPSGIGRNLLEFGEFNSDLESFKGELEFPVVSTVSIETIMNQISQTSNTST